MDLDIIVLSKLNRGRNIVYHLHVESKKMMQMNQFTKQKHTHRLQKQTYSYQKGNVGGRDRLAVWD